ncbi:E9 [Kittiwake papillomavirus 2]|uniref:E9 n=1 Tax=Kittiwake papillomavirus 2 TaxID=2562551 RepID=A0AAE5YN37_9PAPI|nr:E9 [Kittiwake papillomavirus 2]
MITLFCPNWDTCWVVNGDTEHQEDMVTLCLEVKPHQNAQACASAMYTFLRRTRDFYKIECLGPALPALRRRLSGTFLDDPIDDKVDFLAHLCWQAEYLLKKHMPFQNLKIIMPLPRLADLYWYLAPTKEECKENAAYVLKTLKTARASRQRRHLSKARQKGCSYFNAY